MDGIIIRYVNPGKFRQNLSPYTPGWDRIKISEDLGVSAGILVAPVAALVSTMLKSSGWVGK